MPLTLGLRPKLRFTVTREVNTCREVLLQAASDYAVTSSGQYLVVQIPKERQHYWSPNLQISLDAAEEQTQVNALITPMPAVWTLFAFSYILILTLGFFGTLYGLAQWQLKQPAPGLWALPITLGLIAVVYSAALIGQRIGHAQTEELTNFLHQSLEEPG